MNAHTAMADTIDTAYERAFAAHSSDVFRFALAWTNDWSEAEDLAQEAFLRLWNHRATHDWDKPALPWLLVTTRRLATDRFRRLRRRPQTTTASVSLDETNQARWLDVRDAMARLSPLERSALVLTAIEGASYDEAALVLPATAGALRAAVSRARRKLEDA